MTKNKKVNMRCYNAGFVLSGKKGCFIRKYTFFPMFILFLIVLSFLVSCNKASKDEKYRVVILTDMTHDDGNSLIRLLHYSPWFDLEALIVTSQLPDFTYNDSTPWNKAMDILTAYKKDLPGLIKHDSRFPSYEELLSKTKMGRGALPIIWLTNNLKFSGQIGSRFVETKWDSINYHDWIGEGLNPNGESKDSEGSEFLQKVFDKDDERPIYIQAWGGSITLVQALYRYRQCNGDEKFKKILSKLHVYGILFQDITFEYFIDFDKVKEKSCGGFGSAIPTFNGERAELGQLLYDHGHFWQYCCSSDSTWMRPIYSNEVKGHGAMSELFDDYGEGDTPSFLYLLSAKLGLNDPLDPTHGSWGNRFTQMGESFPKGYYHTCNHDASELTRWNSEAKNSFLNRLQWSVKNVEEVNHEPVAVVNGDKSNKILSLFAKPGKLITLDASKSSDPDGDKLTFKWFRYDEADTYDGLFELNDPANPLQKLIVPSNLNDNNIHLVLEVRDNGTPELIAYRRVIINSENN
jgi:hypothetical protein